MIKLIIIFSLFLSSCTTKELWRNGPHKFNTSYDVIKEFMITKDGHKIIILGQKYHYIFNDEKGEITKLLTWSGRAKLEMMLSNFELLPSNKIKGDVTIDIMYGKKLSQNEIEFLKSQGFASWRARDNTPEKKSFNLIGTRYLPQAGVNYETRSSFNKKYNIRIVDNGYVSKIEKVALTPVTVAADGVILVFGTIAYSVTVIAILMSHL